MTSVTATSGGGDAQSIGADASAGGMCGTVTIGCTLDESGNPVGGKTYPDGIIESPYTYPATE